MGKFLYGISGQNYYFEIFYSTTSVENSSGVYAIFDSFDNLLDVGESSELRTRLDNHDRKDCWERKKQGSIKYGIRYTPGAHQSGRMEVEQDIRKKYPNLCGDR